jgi:UDP-N-acetylmuramoyl-tripeptide--D-alanyl-D-alanine ligase
LREAQPFHTALKYLSGALDYWRVRRSLEARGDALMRVIGPMLWPRLAPPYRRFLDRTVFIAITGSVGKTTTKDLVAGILAHRGDVTKTVQGGNQPVDIARSILRTRRRHRFSVHEVGVGKFGQPGIIDRAAALIRPSIAVVTTIGDDHIGAYGSREAIARDKGKIVEALSERGTAVLNADDPLVSAMRDRCRGRVLTYGRAHDAQVRIENVTCRWPQSLAFDVLHGGERVHVATRLYGEHSAGPALAALATAVAAGLPVAAAARALAEIPPTPQRMCPVVRNNVTFMRDDAKAPLWTLPATFEFLSSAEASQRILVIGTISDFSAKSRHVYLNAARRALAVADHVIFVGAHASHAIRARRHPHDNAVQAFNNLAAARAYVATVVRPGALVLLKGSNDDRLQLLMLDPFPANVGRMAASAASRPASDDELAFGIIGLGNDDHRYAGTRHNVGFACLDRLASRFGVTFATGEHAYVARVRLRGACVYLVKPRCVMNASGPALLRALSELRLEPDRSVLVHDDVDLDVGRVRGRILGGAGGHRGVRSVLEAFEDYRFARVKIGIGKPVAQCTLQDHVLGRFGPDEEELVSRGMDAGAEQALHLVGELQARLRASRALLA